MNPDENHHALFLTEGVREAQKRSWDLLRVIQSELKEGMTQKEASTIANDLARAHGSVKIWHKPIIRFGTQTALTFRDKEDTTHVLRADDPYYIDIGPVWTLPDWGGLDYEGDVGATFIFGKNPKAQTLGEHACLLFHEAKQKWKEENFSGVQLYRYLSQRARETGFALVDNVDGHRIGDFPHNQYSKQRLAKVEGIPRPNLWVLEVHLRSLDGMYGAFYEDIL